MLCTWGIMYKNKERKKKREKQSFLGKIKGRPFGQFSARLSKHKRTRRFRRTASYLTSNVSAQQFPFLECSTTRLLQHHHPFLSFSSLFVHSSLPLPSPLPSDLFCFIGSPKLQRFIQVLITFSGAGWLVWLIGSLKFATL